MVYLSRSAGKNQFGISEFEWDPDVGTIDRKAFDNVEAIINLAGAPIFKRWTPEYKSEILRSRVDSTRLIFNTLQKIEHQVKTLVSASAVGYYPSSFEKEWTETDPPGSDFLSLVCQKWEQEAQHFEELGIRVVRNRIGIVLSKKGGALPQIAKPVKFGVGAPLGSGQQWMAWIHLQDLAGIFIHTLENETMSGPFNAVGPHNVTNKELTKKCAAVLNKPFFMPNIPKFALKLAMGEMARNRAFQSKMQFN